MVQILDAQSTRTDPIALRWPPKLLVADEAPIFRDDFNNKPFGLSHNLGNHALFELSRLIELGKFLSRDSSGGRVIVYTDDADVRQGWKRSNSLGLDATESLENIQTTKSWVMLKDIQKHPDYAALLDQFISELENLVGCSLRSEITWIDSYLFIASPNMITPYHIDHESNFLLQIHGEKTVNLFDPSDRTILTEDEIERYYVGDMNAAQFREEIQSKAMVFRIRPGLGVHQPPLAPHWVRNGSEYSVSLSILFFLREFDLKAKIYQANHYLRRLGFTPQPPGHSDLKDRAKQIVMSDLGYRAREKNRVVRFGLNKYRAPYLLAKKLRSRSPENA
jgi:hypothetical protein